MPTDHDIPKLIINKVPTKAQYDQMVKNADELYLIPDDSQGLPDQTGQSGKYLKTDGTDASWESVPAGTVTSVRVQAGTGLASSQSTAQSTTLNTTISIASGYKLPTTTEWGNKQDVISDLSTIRDGASAGATAVQPGDLATVATTGAYSDLSGTPSLSTVAISGSYNDLSNKPTIPTVNDAVLTIQKNGATVSTFTANSATNAVANITVPTKVSDLTNDSGYITGITANNVTTALGYTPYNSSNPSGYITGITANNVTTALGYTPYNSTNPNGYITSADIPTIKNLNTNNTTGQTASASESLTGTGTINLHKVSKTGSYNDLLNKPTIPTVNNATVTIQKNSTNVGSFTLNQSGNATVNITVPTKLSEFTDDLGSSPTHTHSQYLTSHQSIKTLNTTNTTAQSTSASEAITGTGTLNLHKISKTGTFSDLISKPTSISGYGITDAYTKTEVDGLISSVYKPAGSVAYASLPTLASGVLGNVYNVTDAFTTDTRFVEGSGKSYPAGTNVVVVEPTSGTYKFDVLAGFVDLSGYVPTTRKVNNKALSADITLSASDVGALPDSTTIPQGTVKSVQVQAGTGLTSSTSTAQDTTLSTTISIASGYKLPTTTEWGNKQDALATQTAYTSKGSATKVPQITTNNLGQVTGITEVTITQPTVNNGTVTIQKNGTSAGSFTLNQSGNATVNISVPTKVSDLSNDSGFITGITANNVTTALGYTPYNSSNPNGHTSNTGTVKSVQVQAGTGLTSSTSTAQNTTLSTTISIASGYKLPTTTEWSGKQDSLSTQTAYTSKGSATKVPQITTNTLGQVTGITEVTITQPTVNNSSVTIQKNNTTVSTFTLNQSTSTTVNISVPTKTSDLTNDSGFLTAHQSIKTLNTTNTSTLTTSASEDIKGSGTLNLHKVSKTGSYSDLLDKPTIPTVNNAVLTIQKNSATISTFSANASSNVTCNIAVPTTAADVGAVALADGITSVVAGSASNKINVTKNGSTSTITINNVANATNAESITTQAGTDSVYRDVFFANTSGTNKLVYDDDFQYNPGTNKLKIENVNANTVALGGSEQALLKYDSATESIEFIFA